MGCPLVTRAGDTFAGRVAGSILTSAGLARYVAATPEEYERMAIELAASSDRLAALRRQVQAARASSPLFDVPRLVHDLEAAYERMIAETRRGIGEQASLLTSIKDGRE
jgi:predicted O-linked N-acetylglucosamine transferase (SPINDLY family)